MSNEQLEFNIGEDEESATVEMNEDGSEAVLTGLEEAPEVQMPDEPQQPQQEQKQHAKDLDEYSSNVRKRIEKLTARLRETERREQAAIEYAKNVQQRATQLEQQFRHTDAERLNEAKGRMDTQIAALKQVIRQAREEGDFDTETEAHERLTALMMDQRQVQQAAAQREQQDQLAAYQAQQRQALQQQQPAQQPQPSEPDPRAEEWAEQNEWFGKDTAMTHAVFGIHAQLINQEKFDPQSEEYYDELDRRIREAFPHKFQTGNASQAPQKQQRARSAHSVAPATRSSGVNSARRSVKLTPSQVAIAKKLGVPLEEYAKYVKE